MTLVTEKACKSSRIGHIGIMAAVLAVNSPFVLSSDGYDYDYRPYRVGRNHKVRVRPGKRSIRRATTNTHRVNRSLTAARRKANVRRMQAARAAIARATGAGA